MNIDIQFNPNDITIWNYEPNDIKLKGVYIDIETNLITIEAEGKKEEITFSISDFDKDLVKAGGWLNFADEKY